MTRIVIIGGTGYAGGHIAAEARLRGHDVVAVSRSAPSASIDGVDYVQADVLALDTLEPTLQGADVVVWAVAPRGNMVDHALAGLQALTERLRGTTTRLGVIGGAMGSLSAPGGPPLYELGIPDEFAAEAQVGVDTLAFLESLDGDLDWFLVHPPLVFGAWEPGERTGSYRVGGDVVVKAADSSSFISGADFAIAFVDELDRPSHHRSRFTVGY